MIKLFLSWLNETLHKPDKNAKLRRFPVFKQLSSFELYLLNNYLHRRTYKAGEILFGKDYPLEVIFFIEKGDIEVIGGAHPSGRSILKKNEFLGIMDMYYENIRSSTATALTDVSALAISRFDLQELMNRNPKIGVKILSGVCTAFSAYIFHISSKPVMSGLEH